jgi:excinuclease UvrABC helicase subunit UvrB
LKHELDKKNLIIKEKESTIENFKRSHLELNEEKDTTPENISKKIQDILNEESEDEEPDDKYFPDPHQIDINDIEDF